MFLFKIVSALLLTQGITAASLTSTSDQAKTGASSFIVSDVPTRIGDAPYHVSIYYKSNEKLYYKGSGVLIKSNWVLTAARNVLNGTDYVVETGIVDKSPSSPKEHLQIRGTNQTIIHEMFDRNHYYGEYDVALLQLKSGMVTTDAVSTAKLPKKEEKLDADSLLYLSGWGFTETDRLQFSKYYVNHNEFCKDVLNYTRTSDFVLYESQTCVTHALNLRSVKEEAGNPLVNYDEWKDPVVRALLTNVPRKSYGEKIATHMIVTKVSPYVDWINQKTNGALSNATYGFLVITMTLASVIKNLFY